MVIADGVLTPAISVLSGLQAREKILTDGQLLSLACVLLVGLFALQHCGTHMVAFMFAPIVIIWLISLLFISLYNIIHWDPKIIHAISPLYIIKFFRVTGQDGWISLGGVLLAVTVLKLCLQILAISRRSQSELQLYGLVENNIQGDGNCQFRSLSDQLYRSQEHHNSAREQIVNQLTYHREMYEGYVPMAYNDYLKAMKRIKLYSTSSTIMEFGVLLVLSRRVDCFSWCS